MWLWIVVCVYMPSNELITYPGWPPPSPNFAKIGSRPPNLAKSGPSSHKTSWTSPSHNISKSGLRCFFLSQCCVWNTVIYLLTKLPISHSREEEWRTLVWDVNLLVCASRDRFFTSLVFSWCKLEANRLFPTHRECCPGCMCIFLSGGAEGGEPERLLQVKKDSLILLKKIREADNCESCIFI